MTDAAAITHSRVLKTAVPIVISNATIPLLGLVDTGVVGQLGAAAPIGAVGIGATILTALYWLFGFLRMGTTGLTSQAHGAGNTAEVSVMLTRVVMIGFVAGLGIIALQLPLFWLGFQLSPASAEVETMAREYLAIRVYSAPAMIALYGVTGWLIALERTRAVLILQLWMNGLNILFDLWFVLGLGWGVSGVAFATFLAEWSGLFLGIWLCREVWRGRDWLDWDQVFDRVRLRQLGIVNSDIMMRSLMLQGIFMSFLFLGARLGDVTLAANQVLMQFLSLSAYALDGFAFAAEALVGQAFGAGNRAALRRAAVLSSIWSVAIVVVMTLGFALGGRALIDLLTTAEGVRAEAYQYLPYAVLAPVLGVWSFLLDGIFIGATRTRDMRNMMVVSTGIYIAAVLVLMPAFGNHGLWMAILISFVARAVTLAWRYPNLERAAENQQQSATG